MFHGNKLPRKKIRKNGKEVDIIEIPIDPSFFENIPYPNYKSIPECERVYVKGRSWTIG